MKDWRPELRFWTLVLSETILTADPTDIQAPVDIISSPGCDNAEYPYHQLRIKTLFSKPVSTSLVIS